MYKQWAAHMVSERVIGMKEPPHQEPDSTTWYLVAAQSIKESLIFTGCWLGWPRPALINFHNYAGPGPAAE